MALCGELILGDAVDLSQGRLVMIVMLMMIMIMMMNVQIDSWIHPAFCPGCLTLAVCEADRPPVPNIRGETPILLFEHLFCFHSYELALI
jgi:hypothetical protein